MNYRIALIILLGILAGRVEAYPASSTSNYQINGTGTQYATFSEAITAYCVGKGDCGTTGRTTSGSTSAACTNGLSAAAPTNYSNYICYRDAPGGSGNWFGFARVYTMPATLGCPNGGTLSGSNCVCPSGYTDTGTSCTPPPACPAGQHPYNGVCTNVCPGAGKGWNPLDSYGSGATGGISYLSGQKTVCVEVGFNGSAWEGGQAESKCVVEPTGSTIVCSDYGGTAVSCFSEHARYTGAHCESSSQSDVPSDSPDTCDAGDEWCKSSTGNCPAGYTAGTFNGQTLCVARNTDVNVIPRPRSPTAPPSDDQVNNPDTPMTDPAPRTGESSNVFDAIVVGVGPGAQMPGSTGGSTGGGSGSSFDGKIDEAGTPTADGADADAKKGLDAEAKKLTDKISEIASGSNGPNATWGFGITFPSNCSAITIPTNNWGSFNVNFCQWQSIAHDLMSLVWIATTVFLIVGMVFRTMNGSA